MNTNTRDLLICDMLVNHDFKRDVLTRLITLLILLLVSRGDAHASGGKLHITFGMMGFAPYSSIDPQTGKCVGAALERTRELFKDLDVSFTPLCATPARAYKNVEQGIVDLSVNIKSTSAIQGKVSFSPFPFDQLFINFYSGLEKESQRKTVAAVRGYDYNGERKKLEEQGYRFIEVSSTDDAIRLFMNHRTDYLISYQGPYEAYVNDDRKLLLSSKAELSKVKTKQLSTVPTYYAISKNSPKHDKIVAMFEQLNKSINP